MEWFQQTNTEHNDKVNGYCKPPEGESGGSDSCGGTSVEEVTDLQELKPHESEDEEDKEDTEVAPAAKGQKGDWTIKGRKSLDREECKQNRQASSTYTGKSFRINTKHVMFRFQPVL